MPRPSPRPLALLVLLGLLVFAPVATQAAPAASLDKVRRLREMEAAQDDGHVITMDMRDWVSVGVEEPRDFHIFVNFTAKDFKLCPMCADYEESFRRAARSFAADDERAAQKRRGRQQHTGDEFFFVMINVDKDRETAALHGISNVPHIYHSRSLADFDRSRDKRGVEIFGLNVQHDLDVRHKARLDSVLEWAKAKAGRPDVAMIVTRQERVRQLARSGVALAAAAVGAVVGVALLRRHAWLMVVGAIAVHGVSCSGIMSNLLGTFMLRGWERQTGEVEYVVKSVRSQYVLEGAAMGALQVAGPLLVVLSTRVPLARWLGGSRNGGFALSVAAIALLFLAAYCVRQLLTVYSWKAGWYQTPRFFPPAEFVRGPVERDQGLTMFD